MKTVRFMAEIVLALAIFLALVWSVIYALSMHYMTVETDPSKNIYTKSELAEKHSHIPNLQRRK